MCSEEQVKIEKQFIFIQSHRRERSDLGEAITDYRKERNSATKGCLTKVILLGIMVFLASLCSVAHALTWSPPQVVIARENIGPYTSIAVEQNGHWHIAYISYSGTGNTRTSYINYTSSTGTEGIIAQVTYENGYLEDVSIDVDSNGGLHVSYIIEHEGPPYEDYVMYTNNLSGAWSSPQVIARGHNGAYTSIAVDKNGDWHVVYNSWSYNGDILTTFINYISSTGTEGIIAQVTYENGYLEDVSIDVDSNGGLHVSYIIEQEGIPNEDEDYVMYTTTSGEEPPEEPPGWVEVYGTGVNLAMRNAPGIKSQVLKRVPDGWVLKVIDTHEDSIIEDGYTWWEVEDVTDGVSGWSAKEFLKTGDPEELQSKTERKDDISQRIDIILEAVTHYYNNKETFSSLYSSDDGGNAISILKQNDFPIELILAIAAQESGGILFDNDGEYGIMQITGYNGCACKIECYAPDAMYYTNTVQGIYANIKDGLKILREQYQLACKDNKIEDSLWRYCNASVGIGHFLKLI